jgi:hypothetical protein
MRRYPSLTWEYGPKTREILAARDLAAFLDQPVDTEQCEEVRLSPLPNDREEVSGKDAEADTRPRDTDETATAAGKGQAGEEGQLIN